MSDTIREIIIQDVIARLANIRMANGYNTDIGRNVLRARKIISADDLPSCIVWPKSETAESKYGLTVCTMPVLIEGLVEFGDENPSVVSEKMLGDFIKNILSPLWSRSPDYIDSIAYVSGGTDEYPDEEDLTVGTSAIFNFAYTTAIGDPYSHGT